MVKIVGNYSLEKPIGEGQYGKVYRAIHVDTKEEVAIKSIKIDKLIDQGKLTQCLRNQIETLLMIEDNPHVVKFIEMVKTANNLYLVYEYCEGGTLDQELRKCRFFPQRKALSYFKQILTAFRSLSTKYILHRDIKPDNILLKKGQIKLADFGFCKRMTSPDDLTQTVMGSPIYMAPEILSGDLYNSKADIWSLGIVLYEMLFGYTPFSEGNIKQLISEMDRFQIQIPYRVNPVLEGLLRRMLQKQHFRRISWEDLLYEYDVDEMGNLTHKEKGFQFDLMKLMKKNGYGGNNNNSSNNKGANPESNEHIPSATSIKDPRSNGTMKSQSKINWSTITDRKSSVRSEDLAVSSIGDCDLDKIMEVKRKVKQLTIEHTRCLNTSQALVDVFKKQYSAKYSHVIAYFLAWTISHKLENLKNQTSKFQIDYYTQLDASPSQHDHIRRLLMVLADDKKEVIPRLNSIKISILNDQTIAREVFRLSNLKIRNKYVELYLRDIAQKHPEYDIINRTRNQRQGEGQQQHQKQVLIHVVQVLRGLKIQNQRDIVELNEGVETIKLIQLLHTAKRDLEV